MYLKIDKQAKLDDYILKGSDSKPIVIRPGSINKNNSMHAYYVLVVPVQYDVKHEDQSLDSAGMAYQYTIAFYEE